ncbi:MAG TPA: enoyl-CoA hydratase-related protein [Polyangiaceae bacterium]|nr:enoyl-CoA hydratase-related protein [Polyangiaceae bacterium]
MKNLLNSESDGQVVVLTINRPEKLNALNRALLEELARHFSEQSARSSDARPRAVVLTGAGEKAFVAGADIAELAELDQEGASALSELGHELGRAIEDAPFPVIAAVNGFALGGGCELALCCDFIYASERAKFGLPELTLGLIPGFGGTQRLTRRIGLGLSRELVYTGKLLDAQAAKSIGLVNEVFAPGELIERARETARTIASRGPLAVSAAKRVMQRGADLELEAACSLEADAFGALFATEDAKEGTRAFLEKRSAQFVGR